MDQHEGHPAIVVATALKGGKATPQAWFVP